MRRLNLDMDVLRTFVTGIELGSFAAAAERLNRSTSAVSSQLKKLEGQMGTPLLRKAGRGLAPTDAGEALLGYARRLLALNDEAADSIRGVEVEGWVRLGLQEDLGEALLPAVLGRFARAHPRVRIEARIVRNSELLERVESGRLDLALAWQQGPAPPRAEPIAELPMRWIGGSAIGLARPDGAPVPLVSLEAPCLMRTAAIDALDGAGIPWRLAFVSQSLAGLWAAVEAGLGVAVRTQVGLPGRLRLLSREADGVPMLPRLGLALFRTDAEPGPATTRLASILLEAARDAVPRRYWREEASPNEARAA